MIIFWLSLLLLIGYLVGVFGFTLLFRKFGFGVGTTWLDKNDYRFYGYLWPVFCIVFLAYLIGTLADKVAERFHL